MASIHQVRWLLFDWGNTLMRDYEGCTGPMYTWPKVSLMPGVITMLPKLKEMGFHIGLTSNSQLSDASQVRLALKRVGVNDYFDRIYLPSELHCQKPSPIFYRTILQDLACKPSEVIVIGDSLEEDILGAHRIGLQAVWFRPWQAQLARFLLCPQISSFEELPMHLLWMIQ